MALKLIDRVIRLLKADAHGVVENLEERSLLLKQYEREAEMALNEKRARLETLRDQEQQLREALTRRQAELAGFDEDIRRTLSSGRDDLARFAIRRLLPRQKEAEHWRAEIAQRAAEIEALAERVAVQQEQLEALRLRLRAESVRERRRAAVATPWAVDAVVADEEVEIELLRRQRAQDGAA